MRLAAVYGLAGALCFAVMTAGDAVAQMQQEDLISGAVKCDRTWLATKRQAPPPPHFWLRAGEIMDEYKRVVIKDRVWVRYAGYALECDELVYDKTANTLEASGNVLWREAGTATSAQLDHLSIGNEFREGFVRSYGFHLLSQRESPCSRYISPWSVRPGTRNFP